MAYSLFVDSSDNLTLGLLDEKLEWVEFKRFPNKKSSGVFHGLVEELLSSHGKTLFDLDRVLYAAGPGSYTGVRLIEGFCQILRWRGVRTNSFYHFEIPSLLGIESGMWISEAYKGEFFLYTWNGEFVESKLVKKDKVHDFLDKSLRLMSLTTIEGIETESVFSFFKDNSKDIFRKIIKENINRDPFYYRSIENEFTKPQKFKGRI